jgi:hypothetical protein
MTPVKNLLDKIFIDQLFFKEKREDFKCEKPTEQGIVEWRDFVELIILYLLCLLFNQSYP